MNGGGDRLFSLRALKEQDSKNTFERLSDRGWFSPILSLPLQTPICFALLFLFSLFFLKKKSRSEWGLFLHLVMHAEIHGVIGVRPSLCSRQG